MNMNEIWLKSKEYAKENKIPYYHKVIFEHVDDYKKDIEIYGPDVSEIIKYINDNKLPTDNYTWVIGSIEPNERPKLVLSIDDHKGASQQVYEHHYFRIIISLPIYSWNMDKNDLEELERLEELKKLMPELEQATKKHKEYKEEHKKLIELIETFFSKNRKILKQ